MEIDVTWVFLAKRYTLLQLSEINMFCRSLTESLDFYYWEIRLVASIEQLFYTCLEEIDVGTRAFTSEKVFACAWRIYYGNSLCPWELGPNLVRMSWAGSGSQITGPLEAFQTEPRSTYSMLKKYQLNVLRKSPLFFLHTRTNLVAPLCINFALDMSYKNLNCP